jgi:drug/metabolite transporter (DMT)-like permease
VIAIALALGAGTLWGVGDFLGGLNSRRLAAITVLAVSELAGWLAVLVVVLATRPGAPSAEAAAAAAVAGVAGVVGLGCLYRGMAIGAMNVVAPISSASAVIPVAVGLARGERPGALQLLGMVLVLAGVVLVSREPGTAGLAAGAGLALLAAVGFGSYFVFIDVASEDGVAWAILVSRGVATALAFGAAFARNAWRAPASRLPALCAVGLFDVTANGLLALALNEGYVSLVSVLASLYPVVTLALAFALLGERFGRTQAIGAAGALTGVALIAAG